MLTVTLLGSRLPGTSRWVWATARRISSSRVVASARETSGRTRANSSPPQRATISVVRVWLEHAGDGSEDTITDGMAMGIVELLEVVDVDDREGARPAVPERARH